MTSFSQNNEDTIVSKYFGDYKGSFLDLGSNDGKLLSNTHLLYLNGWSGICVEPCVSAFEKLAFGTYGPFNKNEKVWCFNVAIGDQIGNVDFYESGTHFNKGDIGLLSSVNKTELGRWQLTNNKFTKKQTLMWTFDKLLEASRIKSFDFISIDIEGNDWGVLQQIDLGEIKCRCLCIEHNTLQPLIDNYTNYCSKFGMKELHRNQENIIFVR